MVRSRKRRNKAFTLIEIMIALMILSLISVFMAIQGKKLISSYRFEKQISNLFIALQEAQTLAATYQTDISLDFFTEENILKYRFETLEPFKPQKLSKEKVGLSSETLIKFKEKAAKQLHFDIYSGGRIEPRGVLEFFQKDADEEGKSLWIDLQYGHMIKYVQHKPKLFNLQVPEKPKEGSNETYKPSI